MGCIGCCIGNMPVSIACESGGSRGQGSRATTAGTIAVPVWWVMAQSEHARAPPSTTHSTVLIAAMQLLSEGNVNVLLPMCCHLWDGETKLTIDDKVCVLMPVPPNLTRRPGGVLRGQVAGQGCLRILSEHYILRCAVWL